MNPWFRAIAVDYDGTLTTERRPSSDVLSAVREIRLAGLRVILVTGRILAELRADAPDVDVWFDAIVAENGAVVSVDREDLPVAPTVDPRLSEALKQEGVPNRAGQVLVATYTAHGGKVLDRVRRLGLDCHLLHNRGALMILPADVSKGTGLVAALDMLGLSAHECVGIGDAENDHALLETCEVGVAVSNAVEALKAHADLVLDAPNGAGVAAFLRSLMRQPGPGVLPMHRHVYLGVAEDGAPVRIPASQVNLLIRGASGSGKSYLAGLFAESILALDYTLCVIDPEGDHPHLATRPGVILVSGAGPLPPVDHVVGLLARRLGSVVVDLSLQDADTREAYASELLAGLLDLRRRTGLPHWIVIDEAHTPFANGRDHPELAAGRPAGLCVVTYRPEWMCPEITGPQDLVIDAIEPHVADLRRGEQPPERFRSAVRRLPHQRHFRKYLDGTVPRSVRFRFRTSTHDTGHSARNLRDFGAELRTAPDAVIAQHLKHHDFSRWILDVFRDAELAAALRAVESTSPDATHARRELCRLLDAHYPPV